VTALILAGVAVGSLASAATSFLMLATQRELRRVLYFMLGGFNLGGWYPVLAALPYVAIGLGTLVLLARPLNVLQFGDEQARQLGLDVETLKLVLILASSLAAAAAVAFCGIIGFVGLVVPHLVRLLWGPDYRRLVPLSILGGATVLVLADTLAGGEIVATAGQTVEFVISARNTCALTSIKLPLEITGDLTVSLTDYSIDGCRIADWNSVTFQHWDEANGHFTLKLDSDGAAELAPGSGPLIRLTFFVSGAAQGGQVAHIGLGGYTGYDPEFLSDVAIYAPRATDGRIAVGGCCVGIRGNVDGDASDVINVVDLTHFVSYLFNGGAAPACLPEANVSGDATETINVVDLTLLVEYLFNAGVAPVSCY